MDLIERVARELRMRAGANWNIELGNDQDVADLARAAIAEGLDAVEAHLSAVQYDPAPYTAMKHRLAQLRKEAEW